METMDTFLWFGNKVQAFFGDFGAMISPRIGHKSTGITYTSIEWTIELTGTDGPGKQNAGGYRYNYLLVDEDDFTTIQN